MSKPAPPPYRIDGDLMGFTPGSSGCTCCSGVLLVVSAVVAGFLWADDAPWGLPAAIGVAGPLLLITGIVIDRYFRTAVLLDRSARELVFQRRRGRRLLLERIPFGQMGAVTITWQSSDDTPKYGDRFFEVHSQGAAAAIVRLGEGGYRVGVFADRADAQRVAAEIADWAGLHIRDKTGPSPAADGSD